MNRPCCLSRKANQGWNGAIIRAEQRSRQKGKPRLSFLTQDTSAPAGSGRKPSNVIAVTT